MKLTKEQMMSLEEASRPLMRWLNENCHPHVVVIVEPDSAELLEGCARIKTDEFIKD